MWLHVTVTAPIAVRDARHTALAMPPPSQREAPTWSRDITCIHSTVIQEKSHFVELDVVSSTQDKAHLVLSTFSFLSPLHTVSLSTTKPLLSQLDSFASTTQDLFLVRSEARLRRTAFLSGLPPCYDGDRRKVLFFKVRSTHFLEIVHPFTAVALLPISFTKFPPFAPGSALTTDPMWRRLITFSSITVVVPWTLLRAARVTVPGTLRCVFLVVAPASGVFEGHGLGRGWRRVYHVDRLAGPWQPRWWLGPRSVRARLQAGLLAGCGGRQLWHISSLSGGASGPAALRLWLSFPVLSDQHPCPVPYAGWVLDIGQMAIRVSVWGCIELVCGRITVPLRDWIELPSLCEWVCKMHGSPVAGDGANP